MSDDCNRPPSPPSPAPKEAHNEFKFRYDLGQVVDGGISIIETCFFSTGGNDGTLFVLCGNLLDECIMCKE